MLFYWLLFHKAGHLDLSNAFFHGHSRKMCLWFNLLDLFMKTAYHLLANFTSLSTSQTSSPCMFSKQYFFILQLDFVDSIINSSLFLFLTNSTIYIYFNLERNHCCGHQSKCLVQLNLIPCYWFVHQRSQLLRCFLGVEVIPHKSDIILPQQSTFLFFWKRRRLSVLNKH